MNNPLLLLLGTGAMLGLYFPIGKLAVAAGVDPVLWAVLVCVGAGVSMAIVSRLVEGKPDAVPVWRYAVISGFLSYVVPHVLTYSAIPRIGSGLAAIMFALSPVTTALLSLVLKVRPPTTMALVGIGFGLVGALVIIFARNGNFDRPRPVAGAGRVDPGVPRSRQCLPHAGLAQGGRARCGWRHSPILPPCRRWWSLPLF